MNKVRNPKARPFTPFGNWDTQKEAEQAAVRSKWSVKVVPLKGGKFGLLRVS